MGWWGEEVRVEFLDKTPRVPMKFVLKGGERRRRVFCWDRSENMIVSRMMRKVLCLDTRGTVLRTRYFLLLHVVFCLSCIMLSSSFVSSYRYPGPRV
jgi:hypothetical protein